LIGLEIESIDHLSLLISFVRANWHCVSFHIHVLVIPRSLRIWHVLHSICGVHWDLIPADFVLVGMHLGVHYLLTS